MLPYTSRRIFDITLLSFQVLSPPSYVSSLPFFSFSPTQGGLAAKPKAQRYPHNPEEHWGPKARARTIKSAPPAAAAAAGDGGSAGTEANNGNGSAEAEKIEEANGEEPVAKQARRE
jgi:hypothetical protein